jgi:hypothetical protein
MNQKQIIKIESLTFTSFIINQLRFNPMFESSRGHHKGQNFL